MLTLKQLQDPEKCLKSRISFDDIKPLKDVEVAILGQGISGYTKIYPDNSYAKINKCTVSLEAYIRRNPSDRFIPVIKDMYNTMTTAKFKDTTLLQLDKKVIIALNWGLTGESELDENNGIIDLNLFAVNSECQSRGIEIKIVD